MVKMDISIKKVESNRGKPVVIIEGHKYRQAFIKKSGEIRWRCTTKACTATVYTDEKCTTILNGCLDHIHETDPQKLERQILRTACKRKASETISERPSKIICSELMHIEEDHLERKDLKCIRQSMYRERRKLYPAQPKSQQEFHEILDNVGVITNKDEDFVLVNDKESGIVILGCEANLKFLCSEADEVFADGTFKCCPKYFQQLYTIHGFRNGHYIPLVFCLLPAKSGDCYRKMFSLLVASCEKFNLRMNFTTFHVDFEERMLTVVKEFFPDVIIKACRFHLGQSWWRKIQNLGLSKEFKKSGSDISKWLHHFFGLAFLSPEEVADCFAEDLIHDMPKDKKVEAFADYVLSTYVDDNALFPPTVWAETPTTARRTNNGPEAFHRHYNDQFYSSHPSMFVFIDNIIKLQATTYIKLRSTNGTAVRSRHNSEKESFAVETYQKYASGELSRREYVCVLSYKFQPLI